MVEEYRKTSMGEQSVLFSVVILWFGLCGYLIYLLVRGWLNEGASVSAVFLTIVVFIFSSSCFLCAIFVLEEARKKIVISDDGTVVFRGFPILETKRVMANEIQSIVIVSIIRFEGDEDHEESIRIRYGREKMTIDWFDKAGPFVSAIASLNPRIEVSRVTELRKPEPEGPNSNY